jgi:hypothetical protein
MAETTTRIYELQVKLAQDSLAQLKKVQSSTSALEKQFSSLEAAVAGFGQQLLAAFSVGVIVAFVEKSIDAAAALDDLAEKTGASVENLSELQQVARISGTDMGTVETAITKLNKALHQNDEESKKAQAALKAVGLSVEQLRGLDPAEAFKQMSIAFNGFADSGAKSAAIMAILGKNAAEVLPYMRDLATETGITAKVTAEQAAASEELQKSIRRLTNDLQETAAALARELVPWLQKTINEFNEATRIAGGFFAALQMQSKINTFLTPAENLAKLNKELDKNNEMTARAIAQGRTGLLPNLHAQNEELRKRIEYVKYLQREEALALLPPSQRRTTVAPPAQLDYTPAAAATGAGKARRDDAEREAREQLRMLQEGNKSLVESIELTIQLERAQGLAANGGKSWTQVLEEQKAKIDDLTGVTGAAKLLETVEMLDAAYFEGTITLQQYQTALDRVNGIQRKTSEDTAKTASDMEKLLESLGDKVDGYSKSISDALVDFASGADTAADSFGDMANSILRDLAKMATQMMLIEPLMAGFKGWLKSGAGGITANALGGVYDSPSLSRYSNGVYDSPRAFTFAKGGVFAEAGPEAIMPLSRGPDGSLGVDASGAGVTVNVYNETRAQVETKSSRDVNGNRMIEIMVRDAVSAGFRSGAFDGVMGSTYGLNRQGAR